MNGFFYNAFGIILGLGVFVLAIYLLLKLDAAIGYIFRKKKREPQITDVELAEFEAWHRSTKRECVSLTVTDERPTDPIGSKIGGKPFVSHDFEWPTDDNNKSYHFLAQLNFATLPPIPNFPTSGLLLFFIAQDGDALGEIGQEKGETKVIYYPDPTNIHGSNRDQPYPTDVGAKRAKMFPFLSSDAFEHGRTVVGDSSTLCASISDWQFDVWHEKFWGRIGDEKYDLLVETLEHDCPAHFIGGHAQFVQDDPRATISEWRDYDIPLIKFGMDEFIMFGDAGEANFLISAAALKNRDFNNYLFTWDCG